MSDKKRGGYHPVGVPCEYCTNPGALFATVHVTVPCPDCKGVEMQPLNRTVLECPQCLKRHRIKKEL